MCALEDAEELVIPLHPANAVHVKNRGVSRQARPDRRVGVLLSPFKHPGETLPVGLIRQVRGQRLPAGHDQTIQMARPTDLRCSNRRCLIWLPAQPVAGNTRQRVKRQTDRHVFRRRIEQGDKLAFRRLERLFGMLLIKPMVMHRLDRS